jgi:hypothetical protein
MVVVLLLDEDVLEVVELYEEEGVVVGVGVGVVGGT